MSTNLDLTVPGLSEVSPAEARAVNGGDGISINWPWTIAANAVYYTYLNLQYWGSGAVNQEEIQSAYNATT
jgi:hypothetical protein